MVKVNIEGVLLTKLRVIDNNKGDVMHGMRSEDSGYGGFGEAYFSKINRGDIKGWKKHNLMTLNLIVPIGQVKFVLYDDRPRHEKRFNELIISLNNYYRLTVPPNIWVAFKGLGKDNMILNIANIMHDPNESENKDLSDIKYDWSI